MSNTENEYTKDKNKESWSFWDSLNRPKYVVAPMVDQSELPFRLLCRRYSAHLAYTPMLHAKIFSENENYRNVHFHTSSDDKPLIAQFCGNDPKTFVLASSFIKDDVSAIDINLGCPQVRYHETKCVQGIARKGKYGSFLLEYPDLINEIVRSLSQSGINVTCKIRKVEKDSLQSTLNLCYSLEASGCKALTVHGRHRTEKSVNIRECDWESIKIIKSRVNIPVIANGGIENFEDVQRCLDYTGADAVMSSEAILENPYLFSGRQYNNIDIFEEYLSILKQSPRQKLSCIKGHAFKMLYRYARHHHDIRDAISNATSIKKFENIVEDLRKAVSKTTSYEDTWYRRYRTSSALKQNSVVASECRKNGDYIENFFDSFMLNY
ncbi:tRNA-dihydrouridine(20a/20b) synthase (NAD(P)(+)) [Theileria orientalis]|uniref:tRNA-dihydrouridine synthase n=1 Tax=Theileria orientalis TaxID=68886 RepID=A0A976M9C1_THEOR|nr:tRNA-dihydrouridine(20a/20b) synthase (NAD(P)(+)) [Theileria orientalis]